jgi:hypothetical protein
MIFLVNIFKIGDFYKKIGNILRFIDGIFTKIEAFLYQL